MNNMCEPPLEPIIDPMSEYVHVDELEKYANAEYFLRRIIKNLYNAGDLIKFEDDLEELANIFELKLPEEPLKIKGELA